jgi:hypothetical protein
VLLGDGLVALPASSRTVEHLEWLAAGITEDGGSASVWVARPSVRAVGERLEAQSREGIDAEYRALIQEATAALELGDAEGRRIVRRLRREARRIASRDFFGSPVAASSRAALDRLSRAAVGVQA